MPRPHFARCQGAVLLYARCSMTLHVAFHLQLCGRRAPVRITWEVLCGGGKSPKTPNVIACTLCSASGVSRVRHENRKHGGLVSESDPDFRAKPAKAVYTPRLRLS
eukprot:7019842-Prymnesium_polylepis.2